MNDSDIPWYFHLDTVFWGLFLLLFICGPVIDRFRRDYTRRRPPNNKKAPR